MSEEGREEISPAFWVLSRKIAAYGTSEAPAVKHLSIFPRNVLHVLYASYNKQRLFP
jgi:hypothetical protein